MQAAEAVDQTTEAEGNGEALPQGPDQSLQLASSAPSTSTTARTKDDPF